MTGARRFLCESGSCRVVSVTCPRCGEVIAPDATDRSPSAGWVEHAGNFYLAAGEVCARVTSSGSWATHRGRWTVKAWQSGRIVRISKWTKAPTIAAAKLAAEDALRAIGEEILRAVGK